MYCELFEEREISLQKEKEVVVVREFLAQFGLLLDAAVEYTLALYREGRIIATGSLVGEKLCCIAVDPAFQGNGLAAKVVSKLIQEAGRRGHYHYLIYANLETEQLFSSLGFIEVTRVDPCTVLLESGLNTAGR
ncbi:GNAT family N-acetyltransferase [Sporomusa malonica]|uniref:Acetyltransferase (GNAT) domain-containing protein n=1 Tax=Sporomusa malonica TaxID=112901 RepID=A0A1W1Y601_9FIRM|nr:GNAT family N-acetyltransferase [Sporomusa malonica]SMC31612.1 Acetyltransferase (GNAT) domain-containing protein [Sporomusa malonica]